MFGYQGRVLLGCCRVTGFDCGCDAAVQLGAIRLELRLIGHGANQRMMEHIFGSPGESDLIDELAPHQVLQDRINPQRFQ
jgi:hypothetical protein